MARRRMTMFPRTGRLRVLLWISSNLYPMLYFFAQLVLESSFESSLESSLALVKTNLDYDVEVFLTLNNVLQKNHVTLNMNLTHYVQMFKRISQWA